jgi:hypothetical protein
MYTGKCFRLKEAVLGIEKREGRHMAVPIPSGEMVVVLSGPALTDIRMVSVQWQGRQLVMFAEDLESRGTELGQNGSGRTTPLAASM